jgi:DNA polymerase-4
MRTIMHVDLDAFYSSIEQRDNPELRGKPVVVGGDPDRRGVVMTASYEARRFGIHSAMASKTAMRLCPHAILVHPRFDAYARASSQLRQMFLALTPLVEPISFDEAFLDASSNLYSLERATEAARRLKHRIRDELSLTASIGIARNKLVAKVASDREKPDGLTVVLPGDEGKFLAPLHVRRLFGVGPRTEQRLQDAGIERVAQLAEADPTWLMGRFGPVGLEWQRMAQGIDDRPVLAHRELKQSSRERTFPRDIANREELKLVLDEIAAETASSLNELPPARTVTLKLRYSDLGIVTRRRTPGTVLTAGTLAGIAQELLDAHWDGRPLRLMGLGISNFITAPEGQLPLLAEVD